MAAYDFYTLPEWSFVGGESQSRTFTLVRDMATGQEYDLPDATCNFAVVSYVNQDVETPVVKKSVNVTTSADSRACLLTIKLNPIDTIGLTGKYIYQLTIKDMNGGVSIPNKGIMHISNNIDKE